MVASAAAPDGGRNNPPYLFKKHLSPARVRLLEWMQDANFGRIESLRIADGEPVLVPRPLLVREHKFGGENGPRPELNSNDFPLKQQVVELFAFLDKLQNGVIDLLEVKHGLPFRMMVTEVPA
jgi:hypothetical protein